MVMGTGSWGRSGSLLLTRRMVLYVPLSRLVALRVMVMGVLTAGGVRPLAGVTCSQRSLRKRMAL